MAKLNGIDCLRLNLDNFNKKAEQLCSAYNSRSGEQSRTADLGVMNPVL